MVIPLAGSGLGLPAAGVASPPLAVDAQAPMHPVGPVAATLWAAFEQPPATQGATPPKPLSPAYGVAAPARRSSSVPQLDGDDSPAPLYKRERAIWGKYCGTGI